MPTWLTLDAGNSSTVAALIVNGEKAAIWRTPTRRDATADEIREWLIESEPGTARIDRAICASVVPELNEVFREAIAPVPCLFIDYEQHREFAIDVDKPAQMGADRLANIAAAVRVARAPMVIVDAGTATTFCVVDDRPAWIGGAIAPGAALSLNALCDKASRLPRIAPLRPDISFAKSTVDQMLSGASQGHEAMIEGMADRLVEDSGLPSNQMEYIATGGCLTFLKLAPRWRIMPDLTHYGLYVYGCLND